MNDRFMQIVGDEHRYVTPEEAARSIVAAVLANNAWDIAHGNDLDRDEALRWLGDRSCAHWCEQLGINPEYYGRQARALAEQRPQPDPDRRYNYKHVPKLQEDAIRAAHERYLAGESVPQLAAELDVAPSSLRRAWYSRDLATRHEDRKPGREQTFTDDQMRDAYNLYQAGDSMTCLQKKLGISRSTLGARWRELGLQTRGRGRTAGSSKGFRMIRALSD